MTIANSSIHLCSEWCIRILLLSWPAHHLQAISSLNTSKYLQLRSYLPDSLQRVIVAQPSVRWSATPDKNINIVWNQYLLKHLLLLDARIASLHAVVWLNLHRPWYYVLESILELSPTFPRYKPSCQSPESRIGALVLSEDSPVLSISATT